jgi:hypothetical protein
MSKNFRRHTTHQVFKKAHRPDTQDQTFLKPCCLQTLPETLTIRL